MARGKKRKLEKTTIVTLAVAVISCAATVVMVPEVRQAIGLASAGETSTAKISPVSMVSTGGLIKPVSISVGGNNNNVQLAFGRISTERDSYFVTGNNTTQTITLPSNAPLNLLLTGVGNTIVVPKEATVKSTSTSGVGNKIITRERF